MSAAFDAVVQELARAPLARFVAERKRLAGELRAKGDATLAAQLEKRRKPPASAWAVNQLWWHEREAVERMLATASRLRSGELDVARAHHAALGTLREHAAKLLRDAGLGASDATLRRVSTTLAALAAAGGFAPDPTGALEDDREAPGFDALSAAGAPSAAIAPGPARGVAHAAAGVKRAEPAAEAPTSAAERAAGKRRVAAEKRKAAAERKRQHAERQAERARDRELRVRRRAERARLERDLAATIRDERERERTLAALDEKAAVARQALDEARQRTRAAQQELASLRSED